MLPSVWWLPGLVFYFGVAFLFMHKVYFRSGPVTPGPADAALVRTVYRDPKRALYPYWLGVVGIFDGVYIVARLVSRDAFNVEAAVHLALWTLVPPLWFAFEWFYWFDNHESEQAVKTLRTAQDVAGKFWAAVLTLIISYRLGDIVKESLTASSP